MQKHSNLGRTFMLVSLSPIDKSARLSQLIQDFKIMFLPRLNVWNEKKQHRATNLTAVVIMKLLTDYKCCRKRYHTPEVKRISLPWLISKNNETNKPQTVLIRAVKYPRFYFPSVLTCYERGPTCCLATQWARLQCASGLSWARYRCPRRTQNFPCQWQSIQPLYRRPWIEILCFRTSALHAEILNAIMSCKLIPSPNCSELFLVTNT